MGLESLNDLEILQGVFSLIFVVLSLILGFRLILKYFSLKQTEYIAIGFAWVFMSSGWWRAALNFLLIAFYGISSGLDIVLETVFIVPALISWIYAFSRLIYPDLEKKIVLIFAVFLIPYEIFLLIFIVINPAFIGTAVTPFNTEFQSIHLYFLIFVICINLITGSIFAIKSIAIGNPKIKWRGRFLLIAFISFTIGTIFDIGLARTALTLVLFRLLLISSAIEYYFGFLMPKWLTKLLIKER